MVSYYNPAAMAMFSRTGSAHHHHPHHHSSPPQNHYFAPAYSSYHPHHHHHHQTAPPTPVGVGVGGAAAQFSPNMPTDFNCNHQYHHQFGNMTPDSMAAATSWPQQMYGACAAARNIVHPAAAGYEEWGHQHSHVPPTSATTHPSFYPHQQPSPHNSTPSPSSPHTAGHHSPNVYTSATSNHSQSFKIEFGPCSGGNPQENSSQEMQTQGPVVSSAGATISIGTPHSPDSGMAISDGVSSSGSPATGQAQNSQQQQQQHQQQQQQHCLNVASHHHLSSTVPNLNGAILQGSQATNLNNLSQQQSLHTGRPAQARSPYEWMKKPSYSTGSNPGGECRKTRTKDKYRVVYSDTQRLELEKEFHYSRYITIRRKAELASILGLSERQVKIWFQNRRAKERKVVRKREEAMHRDKIASIVQMQNIAVAAAGGMATVSGGPMCNQPNGNLPQLM